MAISTPQDATSAPRIPFDASCWGGLNFRSVRAACPGCGGEDLRTVVFAPNSGLVGPTLYCRNGCVVTDGYPLEETKTQKRQRRKDFPPLWQQAQPFGALPIREPSGFLIGVRLPDGTEVFWPEAVEATRQDTDDSSTNAEPAPTDSPVGAVPGCAREPRASTGSPAPSPPKEGRMSTTPMPEDYVPSLDALRVNFIDGMVRHGNSREDALTAWQRGIAAHDAEVHLRALRHPTRTRAWEDSRGTHEAPARRAGRLERAFGKVAGWALVQAATLAQRRGDQHEVLHCAAAAAVGNTGSRHDPCVLGTHTGAQAVAELDRRLQDQQGTTA